MDNQAVLETFLDLARGLHLDIPDVMEIFEIVAVSSRSQSDTERTVKRVKQVMRDRYQGKYDEKRESADRANQETFVSQNGDPDLLHFPSEKVYAEWIKHHQHARRQRWMDHPPP